ncbi:beta-lactamase [Anopheles sinensis]|uniref:Beta-lactamase n=1 Tax=Anopheles sinensis TaxID=74873 RepID=A0A084VB29_ANOSI|nr:beta-lactamase [Anopheles sinensis]
MLILREAALRLGAKSSGTAKDGVLSSPLSSFAIFMQTTSGLVFSESSNSASDGIASCFISDKLHAANHVIQANAWRFASNNRTPSETAMTLDKYFPSPTPGGHQRLVGRFLFACFNSCYAVSSSAKSRPTLHEFRSAPGKGNTCFLVL